VVVVVVVVVVVEEEEEEEEEVFYHIHPQKNKIGQPLCGFLGPLWNLRHCSSSSSSSLALFWNLRLASSLVKLLPYSSHIHTGHCKLLRIFAS
jgi:hypothetical protein